ncbi:hypothetical protein [Planctomicrobium sp. SH664]|uniref:hypothetical protein n=1 Tax=Planctomicrobium sp. SH664 TaxID=3448125 RepID=UPI003F5B0376
MRKRRPTRTWSSLTHLASMIVLLAVLGMSIKRVRDPGLWTWITSETPTVAEVEGGAKASPRSRFEIPSDQAETVGQEFSHVTDKSPMRAGDMPAYWRFMKWSEEKSFAELQSQARQDPLFTHFWEEPAKWRGQLFELKLRVRRVLTYDAPENTAGVKQIYEAWGWTDESGAFPYVVLFTDLPEGMQLGADVREDVTFVGFFLKVMSYQAGDNPRGAPLFIGKAIRETRVRPAADVAADERQMTWLIYGCGALFLITTFITVGQMLFRRKNPRAALRGETPRSPESTLDWLAGGNLNETQPETEAAPHAEFPRGPSDPPQPG